MTPRYTPEEMILSATQVEIIIQAREKDLREGVRYYLDMTTKLGTDGGWPLDTPEERQSIAACLSEIETKLARLLSLPQIEKAQEALTLIQKRLKKELGLRKEYIVRHEGNDDIKLNHLEASLPLVWILYPELRPNDWSENQLITLMYVGYSDDITTIFDRKLDCLIAAGLIPENLDRGNARQIFVDALIRAGVITIQDRNIWGSRLRTAFQSK